MTPKTLPKFVTIAGISILALGGCGETGLTEAPPVDTTPPGSPVNLTVERVGDTLVITWSPNSESDLAGYNLERSLDHGATWVQLTNNLTSRTDYVDEVYSFVEYRVWAVDNSGNSSGYSSPAVYTTPSGGGGKIPNNPA
ncbi:MAG: hypothetical protein ACRDGR_00895 [bacterium]